MKPPSPFPLRMIRVVVLALVFVAGWLTRGLVEEFGRGMDWR